MIPQGLILLAVVLPQEKKIVAILPRDAIPSIDAPVFVSAEEGDRFLSDDEPVIGVFDGETAKAYSAWQLDRHEVVNDRLGETPIAVTW